MARRSRPASRPAPPEPRSSADRLPTLEEVLVGFQKSLARATLDAYNVSKADPEFSRGTRSLYLTEGLEIDLRVGLNLTPHPTKRPSDPDRVVVDFEAPAETRSSIRFRVGAKPLDYVKGPSLVLASLNPVWEQTPSARYRLYLVDADRRHMEDHPVTLHLAPRDIEAREFSVRAKTDQLGGLTFSVDWAAGSVTIGGRAHRPRPRPSFRNSVSPAWLLWASAMVTEPSAPEAVPAGREAPAPAGRPPARELKSDMYAVWCSPGVEQTRPARRAPRRT